MKHSVQVQPTNSIIFIHDAEGGISPTPIWGAGILATASCVSTLCYPEIDGPTQIDLGDLTDVAVDGDPSYQGVINLTSPEVLLSTVEGHIVLRLASFVGLRVIKIWLSDARWPDVVTIGIGPVSLDSRTTADLTVGDEATRTGWHPLENQSSLFFADGTIPRSRREFDPRKSPDFLALGRFISLFRPTQVRIFTSLPMNAPHTADVSLVVETPSRELWVFGSEGKVLFKIPVTDGKTQLLAWVERSDWCDKLSVAVGSF